MDMFTNYENVPTSYTPNNICDCQPDLSIRKKPLEVYDVKDNLVGYSWYYGDRIVLEFITTGNVVYDEGAYEDAATYLEGKKMMVEFFDFRYEVVYQAILPAAEVVKFYIDNKASLRFVRGAYKCKVTLIDDENPDNVETYTLMDVDDYIFTIK